MPLNFRRDDEIVGGNLLFGQESHYSFFFTIRWLVWRDLADSYRDRYDR